MIGPLHDGPGFDTGAGRTFAQISEAQISEALAALFTAGALSLSLVVALAMLSVDVLRAPGHML